MQPQPPANYDFILNPQKPQRSVVPSSLLQRVAIIGGGAVLLLILVTVVVNLLKGSDTSKPALLSVARQQQELIHLTDTAASQVGISSSNSISAVTIQLSISTEQKELLTYLGQNNIKVKPADLALGVSAKTDALITSAVSGGNYNAVFHTTLKDELTTYRQYLVRAYSTVKGPHGRNLIKQDVANTDLLLTQLETNN
jgi:hypothetical protein